MRAYYCCVSFLFSLFLPHHNNKRFWATVHTSCGQYSIDWCYVGSPSSLFTRENFKSTSMSKRQISLFKLIFCFNCFQSQFQVPTENCHIAGHSLGKLRSLISLILIYYFLFSKPDKLIIIGAHLAGYTGQYLRDRGHMLGRITGKRKKKI